MALYPSINHWDVAGSAAYLTAQTYTRHIAGTAGYSASTNPTQAEVFGFADDSYFKIAVALQKYGYSLTQTGSAVRGVLQSLQGLETAIKIELTAPTNTLSGEGNDRFIALKNARDELMALIEGDGLAQMGATVSTSRSAHIQLTGKSRAAKTTIYEDSDAVPARFRRGWGLDTTLNEVSTAESGD